ncbi:very short patch repair endonuclease [Nocardioides sp. Root190]|uniref:very short patch repair endonuclease n=1 Tax=Nocardioides sp. Root190 TaxID=1736488 RepID=UPI0022857B3E|nr:very short patch repair endonuclease [Nocardioides sp. Root190]
MRARMRSQARSDTAPELELRRELHRRGLRYRVGLRVPGRPRRTIDIAFPARKVAVFVDGCFWHRCPVHSVPAKNNASWWAAKLDGNVARDAETSAVLESDGWLVLRVWEHEPVRTAAERVSAAWAERG